MNILLSSSHKHLFIWYLAFTLGTAMQSPHGGDPLDRLHVDESRTIRGEGGAHKRFEVGPYLDEKDDKYW